MRGASKWLRPTVPSAGMVPSLQPRHEMSGFVLARVQREQPWLLAGKVSRTSYRAGWLDSSHRARLHGGNLVTREGLPTDLHRRTCQHRLATRKERNSRIPWVLVGASTAGNLALLRTLSLSRWGVALEDGSRQPHVASAGLPASRPLGTHLLRASSVAILLSFSRVTPILRSAGGVSPPRLYLLLVPPPPPWNHLPSPLLR